MGNNRQSWIQVQLSLLILSLLHLSKVMLLLTRSELLYKMIRSTPVLSIFLYKPKIEHNVMFVCFFRLTLRNPPWCMACWHRGWGQGWGSTTSHTSLSPTAWTRRLGALTEETTPVKPMYVCNALWYLIHSEGGKKVTLAVFWIHIFIEVPARGHLMCIIVELLWKLSQGKSSSTICFLFHVRGKINNFLPYSFIQNPKI